MFYHAEISDPRPNGGTVVKVGFGEPAQNDQIVVDATAAIQALELPGGESVYINGPASLPAAVAIGHVLTHLYGAVWVFDPKMASYVCCVSHSPTTKVGAVEPL